MRARRLPVVDEYVHGEQVAVFVGDQVVVLSTAASAVLLAAGEEWTGLAELTGDVVLRVGAPPEGDPVEAVTGLLEELARLALVELSV